MATGAKPDPGKRKTGSLHASYLRVANGQQERGYKAGEVYGCFGHRTYVHKPCAREITSSELPCAFCAAGLVPEWRGFLPLWDRDWGLRYVLIGYDYFETADAIPFRAQLTVTRHKNPISPVVPRAEKCLTRELPEKAPWNEPIDMELLCLTLWKEPALEKWILADRLTRVSTSDNPLSLGTDPPGVAEKILSNQKATLGDWVNLAIPGAAGQIDHLAKNDAFVKEVKLLTANGHAQKKKKGGKGVDSG